MDIKFPFMNTISDFVSNCYTQHENCDCDYEISKTITFNRCEDIKEVDIQDAKLNCVGRLLKVNVNLDNACSGRKVAVGVLVFTKNCETSELIGLKICEIKVPDFSKGCKEDIKAGEFYFVLPEENLCNDRKVQVKVIAHYSSFESFPSCPC